MFTTQTQRTTYKIKTVETTTINRPCVQATFVMDVSGSMKGIRLKNATAGAKLIFDQVLLDHDRCELFVFSESAKRQLYMKSKKEVDWNREERGIQTARSGSTALYDAIHQAISNMPRNSKYKSDHRELIILTDGMDNTSSHSFSEIKSMIANPGFDHFHCTLIGVNMTSSQETTMRDLVNNSHSTYIPCVTESILGSFDFVKTAVTVRIEQTIIYQNRRQMGAFSQPMIKDDTVYVAVQDYHGSGNDLWFNAGEKIVVHAKEQERYRGKNLNTNKEGWFPAELVIPDTSSGHHSRQHSSAPATSDKTPLCICVARSDFRGSGKSDLYFKKGERIAVYAKDETSKRWKGENLITNRNGWFPSNLVNCE
jgi:hypothetical protein